MSDWFNGGSSTRPSGFMFTHTGGVDLLDLKPEDVDFEDIAHSLGNQCRFNGHTRVFYSVAQHCVEVSRLLQRRGCNLETQLAGLLHDAGEAYVGDITVPVQRAAGAVGIRLLEANILDSIFVAAGLPPIQAKESAVDQAALHKADKDMGRVEIRDLIHNSFGMVDFSDLKTERQIEPRSCFKPEDAADLWHLTLRLLGGLEE